MNSYYDIYADEDHGILRLVNGYSSVFIILFFCVKYKTNVLLTMLKITSLALLLISLILIIKNGKKSADDYDMNVGYKLLLCVFEFGALAWFSCKKVFKIGYLLLAGLAFILILFFGSRGPLISIALFVLLFYILYLSGVWVPTLTGIALMFGFGNVFDSIVSGAVYRYYLKKNQINICR